MGLMRMDLQPAIFEYLCRYRELGIPGLGKLNWLIKPAQRKQDVHFTPPHLHWKFDGKDQAATTSFVNFLAYKAGVSRKRASEIFEEWRQEQLTNLAENHQITWKHVGTFIKQASGELQFIPDDSKDSFYAREETLELVKREATVVRPELLPMEDNEGITWLEIVLPIILLGLIGVLLYFLWNSLQTNPEPQENRPPIIAQDSNAVQEEVDTASLEGNAEQQSDTDQAVIDQGLNQDSVQEEPKDDFTEEEEILEGEEEKIVQRAQEGECIVVVGSFQNQDLAQSAMDKVQALGLRVYTEPYQAFTRVGVIFDCETQDLYRTLFQLRGKFGEDAWVLKYK